MMKRAVVIALGMICLIGCTQAFNLAQTLKRNDAQTTTLFTSVWKGQTCSGDLKRIGHGSMLNRCVKNFEYSTFSTCSNATGGVTYYYDAADCSGEWYKATFTAVNRCSLDGEGAFASFCGNPDYAVHDFSNAPIPQPIPGDGDILPKYASCDYLKGECPHNTPIKLTFETHDCTGKPRDGNILQIGAQMNKCYLLHAGVNAVANFAITEDDEGHIFLARYQSGCPGVDRADYATIYHKDTCIKHFYGSTKVIVPS